MKPQVILRSCPDYAVERIREIVGDGIQRLGLKPSGRALLKPNLVASGPQFPHAFTRPEVAEGVLLALKDHGEALTEVAFGERSGITIPTRYAASLAGYKPVMRRNRVGFHYFDESPQVAVGLSHGGRLRDLIYTPAPVAAADYFVNMPKFKAHPWTTVTFSMKNYIGIQDDAHRLIDHDHRLNKKVADLQYVLQPRLIVVDAITGGEGRMLTPLPFHLGMLILGDNQVALDSICCHILGIDPMEVEHIRLAHERGFGPVSLDEIELSGDLSLEAAQQRAEGFSTGLIRVEDYFKGTNIRAYSGRPPGDEYDYCWGGCPGALEEAIEILRAFDAATDEKMPPVHLVFGRYEGVIEARPGERVVFIGDCAEYRGRVGDRELQIESLYSDPAAVDPTRVDGQADVFAKMLGVKLRFLASANNPVIRLAGCPVSVADQVLALVSLGGLKNPLLDRTVALQYTSSYLSVRTRRMLRRLVEPTSYSLGGYRRGAAQTRLPIAS